MIRKGNQIELDITDVGANAEGIGHYDGYTVFVPLALKGEKVMAEAVHVSKSLLFTKLIKVIKKVEDRVVSPCSYYPRCGGCDYLHLDYIKQLDYKKDALNTTLSKMIKTNFLVSDIVPSDPNLGYRNKVQLPFGLEKGKVILGFYEKNTHNICAINKCLLHGDWLTPIIDITLEYVRKNKIKAFVKNKGTLRHLVVRNIEGNICVTIVATQKSLPNLEEYYSALNSIYPGTTLYININKENTNVIMGAETILVGGHSQKLSIMGIKTYLNPLSFFQINDNIREKLYDKVISIIAPSEKSIIIDAYSGVGLMGAIMAKRGAQIINIDECKEAIDDANALYKENKIDNLVVNICGDAGIVLPEIFSSIHSVNGIDNLTLKETNSDSQILPNKSYVTPKQTISFKKYHGNKTIDITDKEITIILDPPRKGVSEKLIKSIEKAQKFFSNIRVIYISCNPATLARDLELLTEFMTIEKIIPYDMFAQTKHLETLVCLTRK